MIKKLTALGTIAFVSLQSLFAQDTTKTLTFSGSVDVYYRHNFGDSINDKTSFTKSNNAFALGMASLRADASALSGKLTATADLGFGKRAEEFSYRESGTLAMVKQLYATYAVNKMVKVTAGKFATHVGYEVMDAPSNRNYSMSYMFTNGPFTHTGVKVDITEGQVGFMVGLANYIDQTTSNTDVKTFIAQVSAGSKNGKLKAYLNYAGFAGSTTGSNPDSLKAFNQVDLVATAVVSDKFNIGFNATMQDRQQIATSSKVSSSWKAAALYLNVDPSTSLGLTLRSEYISDNKLVYFATKNIFANTLSLNYKVGPLTIIPELRYETAESNFFTKSNGTGSKETFSALLAAVYKF